MFVPILLVTTMSTNILNPLCSVVRSARGTLNTVSPTLVLLAGSVSMVTPSTVPVYRAAWGYIVINCALNINLTIKVME